MRNYLNGIPILCQHNIAWGNFVSITQPNESYYPHFLASGRCVLRHFLLNISQVPWLMFYKQSSFAGRVVSAEATTAYQPQVKYQLTENL